MPGNKQRSSLQKDTDRWLTDVYEHTAIDQLHGTLELVSDLYWSHTGATTLTPGDCDALRKIITHCAQHPILPRAHQLNALVLRIMNNCDAWIPMREDVQQCYVLAAALLQGKAYTPLLVMQEPDYIANKWQARQTARCSRFHGIRAAWSRLFNRQTPHVQLPPKEKTTIIDLATTLFGDTWTELYATDLASSPAAIAQLVLHTQPPFTWVKTELRHAVSSLPADLTEIQF